MMKSCGNVVCVIYSSRTLNLKLPPRRGMRTRSRVMWTLTKKCSENNSSLLTNCSCASEQLSEKNLTPIIFFFKSLLQSEKLFNNYGSLVWYKFGFYLFVMWNKLSQKKYSQKIESLMRFKNLFWIFKITKSFRTGTWCEWCNHLWGYPHCYPWSELIPPAMSITCNLYKQ